MILAMCGGLDARTEGCVVRGPAFGPLLHTYPDPWMGGGYFSGGLERLFMQNLKPKQRQPQRQSRTTTIMTTIGTTGLTPPGGEAGGAGHRAAAAQ